VDNIFVEKYDMAPNISLVGAYLLYFSMKCAVEIDSIVEYAAYVLIILLIDDKKKELCSPYIFKAPLYICV